MNGMISISVAIVFIIAFSSFFTLNLIFPEDSLRSLKDDPFFDSTLKSEKPIFLLGHSLVAQLNITKINDIVTNEYEDILVYNLGTNKDNPSTRLLYLDGHLDLKPTHIFYGVYYRDFYSENYEQQDKAILPDPKINFKQFIEKNNQIFGPFNSKITTLKVIRTVMEFTGLFPHTTYNKIFLENAPFSYYAEVQTIIHTDSANLERYEPIEQIQNIKINDESKIKDFKEIIRRFQQQGTSVVIFLVPLHSTYLSNIQPDENKKFEKLILDIEQEFDVPVYDFRYRYADLPIWLDVSHVAYHKDSMIYSKDVADMILSELP